MFSRAARNVAWSPPAEFEWLLAYYRASDRDASRWQAIRQLLDQPRWRAHWDSIQYLQTLRSAAQQDGLELRTFQAITSFCHAVARDPQHHFSQLADGSSPGVGSLEEWKQHINECVYCRRMWHRWDARRTYTNHGLPPGEPLLCDWLLERHYAAALDNLTAELSAVPEEGLTALSHTSPPLFLKKMRFVAPLLLERVLPPDAPLAELTNRFLDYLEQPEAMKQLREATHVRDKMGQVLGQFFREQGWGEADSVRAVTRQVMDNILWQLAAAGCQERARPGVEQAALQAVQEALRQRLNSSDTTPVERVTIEALAPFLAEAPELLSDVRNEYERLVR